MTPIPDRPSTMSSLAYWARYKSFWVQAISRILAINGIVGCLLWAIDVLTGAQNRTLLLIRGNLPLTLFAAALIALAYAVARLAFRLNAKEPLPNLSVLVLVLIVVVAVTSIAGPSLVAISETVVFAIFLAVVQLRRWQINAYVVLKSALILGAITLVGGVAGGIGTGELLQMRVSPERLDGLMRLILFSIGVFVYFFEERRQWLAAPPTPVIIEKLQRACKENDFTAISRWLGDAMRFSQADQRLLASLVLPRRLIVDGDVAILFTPHGDIVYVRVKGGKVQELRPYASPRSSSDPSASRHAEAADRGSYAR